MKILAVASLKLDTFTKGFEGMEVLENIHDLNRFWYDHIDEVFDIEFDFYILPNDAQYSDYEEYNDEVDEFICNSTTMSLETAKLMLSRVPTLN